MLVETQAKLRVTQQRSEHLLHLCTQGDALEEIGRTLHERHSPRKRADNVEHHRNHETMRREQAAVKIQSRVRGVQCRRLGAKRPKQRKVAATKLEAYSAHPRVQVDWHCEQEKAAVRIQARQRGVRDRRKVKMEQERRHGAAVKIQARQRGLCERQRLREERERRQGAAVKIQSRVRGWRGRQQARGLEEQRRKEEARRKREEEERKKREEEERRKREEEERRQSETSDLRAVWGDVVSWLETKADGRSAAAARPWMEEMKEKEYDFSKVSVHDDIEAFQKVDKAQQDMLAAPAAAALGTHTDGTAIGQIATTKAAPAVEGLPQAHEEGLEYGVNAVDIAADNMAATFVSLAVSAQKAEIEPEAYSAFPLRAARQHLHLPPPDCGQPVAVHFNTDDKVTEEDANEFANSCFA